MFDNLYNHPGEAISHLEDNLSDIEDLTHKLISSLPSMRFYSTSVPDMPDGTLIAFFRGDGKYMFYVERSSGSYARLIPKEQVAEFIFTPLVFDLNLGGPVNTDEL